MEEDKEKEWYLKSVSAPLIADFFVNWVFSDSEKSGLSTGLLHWALQKSFSDFTGDSLGQHLIFLNICQKASELSTLQKSKHQKL